MRTNKTPNLLHAIIGFFIMVVTIWILLNFCNISFSCGRGGQQERFCGISTENEFTACAEQRPYQSYGTPYEYYPTEYGPPLQQECSSSTGPAPARPALPSLLETSITGPAGSGIASSHPANVINYKIIPDEMLREDNQYTMESYIDPYFPPCPPAKGDIGPPYPMSEKLLESFGVKSTQGNIADEYANCVMKCGTSPDMVQGNSDTERNQDIYNNCITRCSPAPLRGGIDYKGIGYDQ